MRPLLRTQLTAFFFVLTFFTSFMILLSFASTNEVLTNLSTLMASTIKWELILTNTSPSKLTMNPLKVPDLGKVADDLRTLTERLSHEGKVRDYIAGAGYVLTLSGCGEGCSALQELNGTEVLIVKGCGLSNPVAIPARFLERSEEIMKLLNLSYREVSMTQVARVEELTSYLGQGWVQPAGNYYAIRYAGQVSPLIIAVPEREGSSEISEVIKALLNASTNCGCSLKAIYLAPTAIIDLSPESYVNPASTASTYRNLLQVGEEISEDVGTNHYYLTEESGKLLNLSFIEFGVKTATVLTLSLPVLVIVIATRYIVDSAILTSRKEIGLLRLRGITPKKLKMWLSEVAMLSWVSGIGATYLITAFWGINNASTLEAVQDPYVAIIAASASAIILAYAFLRSYGTMSSLLPRDAVKTDLAPEELLQPLKVGRWGWAFLSLSALFVVEGLSGLSAQAYLAQNSTVNLPTSVLIGLITLAVLEGVLKPFTPLFLAYGLGKVVASHLDSMVTRLVGRLSGYVGLTSKALTKLLKRRAAPIVILTVFAVTILTNALGSAAYIQSQYTTAAAASVGAEYLAVKKVLLLTPSSLSGTVSKFLEAVEGRSGTAVIVVPIYLQGEGGINSVILLNVTDFLSTTYWFREWGIEESFNELLLKVSKTGKAVAYGLTIPSGIYSVKSFPMESSLGEAEIIGHVEGFPAAPNLGLRGGDLVAGSWLLKEVLNADESVESSTPHLTWITLAYFTNDGGIAEELVKEGFKVISLSNLKSSPTYRLLVSVAKYMSPGMIASATITVLSLLIAGAVAWAIGKESLKLQLLLRVRGVREADVMKVVTAVWGFIAAVSVGAGLLGGYVLTASKTLTFSLGFLTPSGMLQGFQAGSIDLGLGTGSKEVPPQAYIASSAVALLITLIPALITLNVYRESFRKRFIEVR